MMDVKTDVQALACAQRLATDLGPGWEPYISVRSQKLTWGARRPAGRYYIIDVRPMAEGDPPRLWQAAVMSPLTVNHDNIADVLGPLAAIRMTPREALEVLALLSVRQLADATVVDAALDAAWRKL